MNLKAVTLILLIATLSLVAAKDNNNEETINNQKSWQGEEGGPEEGEGGEPEEPPGEPSENHWNLNFDQEAHEHGFEAEATE